MNRVSIRNKTFGFDGAGQEHTLTAVIVNAASIQRAYYSEAFDVDKPHLSNVRTTLRLLM